MANGTLAVSQLEILTQSGTGIITVVPPATNTNRTITLPDSTGTMATAESTLVQFNASGSAPVYAVRAWVNFNGTGTVAIRASGNVSSITDDGTGLYTVNFTTALSDANYSVNLGLDSSPSTCGFSLLGGSDRASSNTTSSFRINTYAGSFNLTDYAIITAAVFR